MRHKHHIVPKHRGGTDDPSNLVEITPTQHAMFHFCEWKLWGDYKDFCAYKMILGDVKNPEFRSARTKAFSHILVRKAREAGVFDYEMSRERGVKGNKSQRDKFEGEGRTIAEKSWILTKENGEKVEVTNLAKYCRENNLSNSHLCNVAKGNRKSHKGYIKVERLE
jgi:hypothetical protein